MRLDTKFRMSFLYPLVFSVIVSFLIVVLVIIKFSRNYNNNLVKDDLQSIDSQKSSPVSLTVNNILFQKFQKSIYSLILIKKHYDLYRHLIEKNNFNLTESDPRRLSYNQNYFINAYNLSDYKNKMFDLFKTPKNTDEIYDHAYWFVDKKLIEHDAILGKSKNNTNDQYLHYKNLHNEFAALQYTFPMIRSVHNSSRKDGKTIDSYDSIYFASSETRLFYGYPIDIQVSEKNKNYFNETSFFFKKFKKFTFSGECLDENGNQPDYFYFQCRDWWIQLDTEFKNQKEKTKEQIVITNPYKFAGDTKYGITTCLRFINDYAQGDNQKISAFCLDMDMTDLQMKFDELNRILSGYFYVLKVNTHYTIYYPFMNTDGYFSNLERLEFDMVNQYYVSELSDFSTNILKKMNRKIDYSKWEEFIKDTIKTRGDLKEGQGQNNNATSFKEIEMMTNGYYFKNQKNFTYIITPVYFYENLLDEEKKSHMLSIIYVFENSVISQNLNSFITSLYPRLVFQIILNFLFAVILVEISWHLITTIGFNIVRPIKNLKFQIRGMNAENTDFDKKLQSRDGNRSKKEFSNGLNLNNEEEATLLSQQHINKIQNSSFLRSSKTRKIKSSFLNSNGHSSKLERIKSFNKRSASRRSTRKKSEYQAFSEYNANSDDSFSEELDEDDLGIISSEMSGLFNTVIELKNIITFTLDKNAKYDSNALIKYLNSVHMFAKVQNYSAEKISESNLATMLLNFKKFNYAVYHLKKCLIDNENSSIAKLAQELNALKKIKDMGNSNNINANYNSNLNINNINIFKQFIKQENHADDTKSVSGLKAVGFLEKEGDNISENFKNIAGFGDTNKKEYEKTSKGANTNFNGIENEFPLVTINSNITERIGNSLKKLRNLNFANILRGKVGTKELKKDQKNKIICDIKVINVKDLLEMFEKNLSILEQEINMRQTLQKINLKKLSALYHGKNKNSTFSYRSNENNDFYDSPNHIVKRKSPFFDTIKSEKFSLNLNLNCRNDIINDEGNIVFDDSVNYKTIKNKPRNSRSLNLNSNIAFTDNKLIEVVNNERAKLINEIKNSYISDMTNDKDKSEIVKISSNNVIPNNIQNNKKIIKLGNNLSNSYSDLAQNAAGNSNNLKGLNNSHIIQNEIDNKILKETNFANFSVKNVTEAENHSNSIGEPKGENIDNYEFSEFPILNIKSRYPKLIYSFKTYFKSIRNLFKNKNLNKAKFLEDILIINELNSDLFEKVILLYIHESMLQKNVLREMEGVLEYIDFLIVFKLKIFLISERQDSKDKEFLFTYLRNSNKQNSNYENLSDNFYHNSEGEFKYNFSNNRKNKIEEVKSIMQKIKFFFLYFELLKKKFILQTNPDYFKNFLEIITEKRIDDLDLTEIPYSVLIMQAYYLKGKLAKISGHYNKALEFFYRSREYLNICDAWIIKKSNKNIRTIYSIIFHKIDKDIDRIENARSEAELNLIEKIYFNNFNGSSHDSKKLSPEVSSKNSELEYNNHNFKLQYKYNNNKFNNNFNAKIKNNENGKFFNFSPNGVPQNNEQNSKNIKKHFHKNQQHSVCHKQINNNNNQFNEYNSNYNNKNKEANENRDSHPHSSNQNLKQMTIQQKIEKKKPIILKYKNDINQKIALLDKEINSFRDYNKDLLIVVDISGINDTDIKKYENLLKLCCGFYENFVSLGDRFGVFHSYDSITPLIPFDKKQTNNLQFTKNNLNSAAKNLSSYGFIYNINPIGKVNNGKIKICKTILLMFEYLNKKWNCENEKWLILFLSNFDLDYENKRKIENESLIKKYLNLIIIGIDFDHDSIIKVKDFLRLFGDKSNYFGDDNVGGMKSIFRKKVLNENKYFFPFEIYKTGKINNLNNCNK